MNQATRTDSGAGMVCAMSGKDKTAREQHGALEVGGDTPNPRGTEEGWRRSVGRIGTGLTEN